MDANPDRKARFQQVRDACLLHASELVAGARLLYQNDLPHLALNYAVIAIEEVGKCVLIRLGDHGADESEGSWSARALDDHVRKLFFSLWGPSFGREVTTAERIEELDSYARRLHEKRLRALYVESGDTVVAPRDSVPTDEIEAIIKLAAARLELERTVEFRDLASDERQRLEWFVKGTRDQGNRAKIFSGSSMAKLAEFGDCHVWIAWLKEQFDTAERQSIEMTRQEMERHRPTDGTKDKWRLKFRVHSFSHAIRPQALSGWNEKFTWIKLFRAGSTGAELSVEMTLQDDVLIHDLWWAGISLGNQLLIALNIGTRGFFWWQRPQQIDRYWEKVTDLEHNQDVQVHRRPALRLDWGTHKLDEQTLAVVSHCFAKLPRPNQPELLAPFDAYLTGLAWFGKTDIHTQFEMEAFSSFWLSLRDGLRAYGDWNGFEPYRDAYERVTSRLYPKARELLRYHDLGASAQEGRLDRKRVTLSEVGAIKVLVDGYLATALWKAPSPEL